MHSFHHHLSNTPSSTTNPVDFFDVKTTPPTTNPTTPNTNSSSHNTPLQLSDDGNNSSSSCSNSISNINSGSLNSSSNHNKNHSNPVHRTSSTRIRTRTTPEQLAVLEETFLFNFNPNSTVRDILSKQLGMTERAVQVWFQNRRAKAKLLEKRSSLGDVRMPFSSSYNPSFNQHMKHKRDIFQFPCQTLSVGTWRRISMKSGDLECCADLYNKVFIWELKESGARFKLSIPFAHVKSIVLEQRTPLLGKLKISISNSPEFFLKDQRETEWSSCQDFTEGKQASSIMEHDILGNYTGIKRELATLLNLEPSLKAIASLPSNDTTTMSQLWARRGSLPVINSAQGANAANISVHPTIAATGVGVNGVPTIMDSPAIAAAMALSSPQSFNHRMWMRRSSVFNSPSLASSTGVASPLGLAASPSTFDLSPHFGGLSPQVAFALSTNSQQPSPMNTPFSQSFSNHHLASALVGSGTTTVNLASGNNTPNMMGPNSAAGSQASTPMLLAGGFPEDHLSPLIASFNDSNALGFGAENTLATALAITMSLSNPVSMNSNNINSNNNNNNLQYHQLNQSGNQDNNKQINTNYNSNSNHQLSNNNMDITTSNSTSASLKSKTNHSSLLTNGFDPVMASAPSRLSVDEIFNIDDFNLSIMPSEDPVDSFLQFDNSTNMKGDNRQQQTSAPRSMNFGCSTPSNTHSSNPPSNSLDFTTDEFMNDLSTSIELKAVPNDLNKFPF